MKTRFPSEILKHYYFLWLFVVFFILFVAWLPVIYFCSQLSPEKETPWLSKVTKVDNLYVTARIKWPYTKSHCQELYNKNIFAGNSSLCGVVTAQQRFSGTATAEHGENVRPTTQLLCSNTFIHRFQQPQLTSTDLHTGCQTYPSCSYSAQWLLFLLSGWLMLSHYVI